MDQLTIRKMNAVATTRSPANESAASSIAKGDGGPGGRYAESASAHLQRLSTAAVSTSTVELRSSSAATTTSTTTPLVGIHVPPIKTWQSFVFSATAATIAAPFTNPFAVAKTQLQVQRTAHNVGRSSASRMTMMGFFHHSILVSKDFRILQRGLIPVMMREASKNLFRIGLYKPILGVIHNVEEKDTKSSASAAPIYKRMIAGGISGAIGFGVCNPFEIIRIKAQAMPLSKPSSSMTIARDIFRTDGIAGFYKAANVSIALGIVCTSVNLTTYTWLHDIALADDNNLADGPLVDMACALASGFCAAIAMNPIDVIRTRIICAKSTFRREGTWFCSARPRFPTLPTKQ